MHGTMNIKFSEHFSFIQGEFTLFEVRNLSQLVMEQRQRFVNRKSVFLGKNSLHVYNFNHFTESPLNQLDKDVSDLIRWCITRWNVSISV